MCISYILIYTIYLFYCFLLAQKWLDSTHRSGVLDLPPSLMEILSCCSTIYRWWDTFPKFPCGLFGKLLSVLHPGPLRLVKAEMFLR